MNIVVIVADTFRTDHLGCYGNPWIHTPNLDRMAAEGAVFEHAYADGLPTIPARRVYFTGRSLVPWPDARQHRGGTDRPWLGWEPIEKDAPRLPLLMKEAGYTTAFITDVWHYFKPEMNFHHGFDSWQWIRGQEDDPYQTGPTAPFERAAKARVPERQWNEHYLRRLTNYLRNLQDHRGDEGLFAPRVTRAANTWLERNADNKPFFLWIDMFDPHEPFDPPRAYAQRYCTEWPCNDYIAAYHLADKDIRDGDWKPIRALYAGECSFVDMCVGRLLDKLRQMGLLEETAILFTTDHGTTLGERTPGYSDWFTKQPHQLQQHISGLPLVVRHPDAAGKRVPAVVSAEDIFPTLLSWAGAKVPAGLNGKDFWPLAAGGASSVRDHAYSAFADWASVRDLKWNYVANWQNPAGNPARLYDLEADPSEQHDVIAEHPDVARQMQKLIDARWWNE